MAVTFPYDLLAGFPGWQATFELYRRQELSRSAFGRTFVKDLGDPIWRASYVSKNLKPNQLDNWRARLDILDGGVNTFRACVISRCYPIAHPRGAWPGGASFSGVGALSGIAANRKEIRLNGLPVGTILSPGDVIMIGEGRIHRVVVGAVMGTTQTGLIEIRPHLRPGVVNGTAATIVNPWSLMSIDPESRADAADLSGKGSITFSATEVF